MDNEDVTLQELIVRALTGRDENARASLREAAESDAELGAFCADLEDVVRLLAGSTDWRAHAPSEELTARIRQAVVAKLPAAPPHFKTVLLEADLGRRRAARRLTMTLAVASFILGAALVYSLRSRESERRLSLNGQIVLDAIAPAASAQRQFIREEKWVSGADGLHPAGTEESGALLMSVPLPADAACALSADVRIPELSELSSATVFLADAAGEKAPAFDTAARPRTVLALEITADGMVLNGPGRALLQSRPDTATGARFCRIRIEYLGTAARVLLNNAPFFDGAIAPQPRGPLFAGVRVAGPRKNEIIFNALRIER